ncbi:hypothetical protein AB7W68_11760 [Providencia rettgeri]
MKKVFIIAALLVLSGCSNKTGLGTNISKDSYDGNTVISIEEHGNDCQSFICTGLGAQWNSKNKDKAILYVSVFNKITTINAAEIKIDGKEFKIAKKDGYSDFDSFSPSVRKSSQAFLVDFSLIKAITAASDARLRVYTSKGQISDVIVSNGKDSKAYYALKRFVDDVEKAN